MTQASGLDKRFSQSSLLFPCRSSPFVCLADALEVLILLFIHILRGTSIRKAALEVNWQRARYRLGHDLVTLEDSPAEKHPIPFGILFVATLLQAIKLFGFQGVLCTKVWAGLYLSSFVVLALVGFLAPKDWREFPPETIIPPPRGRFNWWKLEDLSKFLLYASLAAHFLCCSWVLDRVIGEAPEDIEALPWGVYYALATFFGPCAMASFLITAVSTTCVLVPLCLLYLLYQFLVVEMGMGFVSNTVRSHWQIFRPLRRYCSLLPQILLTISVLVAYLVSMILFGIYFSDHVPLFDDKKSKACGGTALVGLAILIRGSGNLSMYTFVLWGIKNMLKTFEKPVPLLKRLNSVLDRRGIFVFFAFANFILALLYYCIRYDSRGTFKPSWTDKLG